MWSRKRHKQDDTGAIVGKKAAWRSYNFDGEDGLDGQNDAQQDERYFNQSDLNVNQ